MALRLTEEQALEAVTACMDKALEDPTGVFSAPFAHLRKAKGKLLRAKLGIRAALGEDGCVPDALPPSNCSIWPPSSTTTCWTGPKPAGGLPPCPPPSTAKPPCWRGISC